MIVPELSPELYPEPPLEYHPLFRFIARLYREEPFGPVASCTLRFGRPLSSPELRKLEAFLEGAGDPPLLIREASATHPEAGRPGMPLLEGEFRTAKADGRFVLEGWEGECRGIDLTDREGRKGFYPLPQGNAGWYYRAARGETSENGEDRE